MTNPGEPLKVDPNELLMTANRIDGHAAEFRTGQDAASARAGSTGLGSGVAAAALPQMLEAWGADGMCFAEHFDRHAQQHRKAAPAYSRVDAGEATDIDDAGAKF